VTVSAQPYDPIGSLDGLSLQGVTATVNGWAIDPDAPTSPAAVHVYLDGALLTAVAADGQRPDLAAALPGAGAAHGFSASGRLPAGAHTMCAYVINAGPGSVNTGLGCRTVTVAPDAWNPSGSLDGATVSSRSVRVSGWAVDPDSLTAPVDVHFYVDGRFATALTASQTRPDIAAAVPGAGPSHGYVAAFDALPGSHNVCAYAINIGGGTANPQLGCRTVAVESKAWDPQGSLDTAVRSGSQIDVSGWAFDPDIPDGTLAVHVYVDGAAVLGVPTGQPRPDVPGVYPVAGPATGYSGSVAVSPGSHRVCTYALNVGAGGVNPLLGCRTVA
jgi:hypothetical protein